MCSSLSWVINKSKFAKRFDIILDETDSTSLSDFNKSIMRERYIPMVNAMIMESIRSNIFFTILQSTITFGSILVPALLSTEQKSLIYNSTSEQDIQYQHNLYWIIWGISLSVTLSNAIVQLSSMDKKYIMRHINVSHMKKEGWLFLQKSGKIYGKYVNQPHDSFVNIFWERVERFRFNCVTNDLSYDTLNDETLNNEYNNDGSTAV
tara:strand:- start:49 stop:669 length:621 start_codon:yes stop_codon:yes gene_type:complete